MDIVKIEEASAELFQTQLLQWFDRNARTLPWREYPSPYRVWISEVMLQQTRVEAVKPYFERFLSEIPDVKTLAEISDERLMKLWEGLGYYSRARNLKKAAQVMLKDNNGEIPSHFDALKKLPGIGPYTAGAVASIAFGQCVPAIDGNVQRVISRITAMQHEISTTEAKKEIEAEVTVRLPEARTGDFNQALMELGATICLPNGAPLCHMCPMANMCLAKNLGIEEELPHKAGKKARKIEHKTIFVIRSGGKIALRKRPEHGLLSNLWELPSTDGYLTPEDCLSLLETWGIRVTEIRPLPKAKHIFTHIEWHMIGYQIDAEEISEESGLEMATAEEINRDYSVPTAFRAYLRNDRDHNLYEDLLGV